MINHLSKRLVFILTIVLFATIGAIFTGTRSVSADTNDEHPQYDKIYETAKSKLGTSYSYGAVGPNRFDCSGFTQYVYRKADKNLPRTAQAQYSTTKKVAKADRQKGDLVFFGYSKRSISHVGIYVGNGKMINAQNRGVITENVNSPWWNAVGYSRP